MKKNHHGFRLLLVTMLVAALGSLFAAPGLAEEAANPDRQRELPGDIILHLTTGSFDQAMGDIESFIVKVTEGTPVAMLTPPGFLKKLFTTREKSVLFGATIDTGRNIQFVLSSPAKQGSLPPLAIILPMNGFADKLKLFTAKGLTVKNLGNGAYSVTTKQKTLLMLPFDDNFVLACEKKFGLASLKHFEKIFKTDAGRKWLNYPVSTKEGAAVGRLTINVAKALQVNAPFFARLIEKAKRQVAKFAAKPETPLPLSQLAKIAPEYLDYSYRVLGMIDRLDAAAYANGKEISWQISATPKPETLLAKITTVLQASTAPHRLVGYLPKAPVLVQSSQANQKVIQLLLPIINNLASNLLGHLQKPAETARMLATFDNLLLQIGADTATAIISNPKGSGQTTLSLIRCNNPADYLQNFSDFEKQLAPLVQQVMEKSGLKGFAIKAVYNDAAGKIAGVPYRQFSITITPPKGKTTSKAAAYLKNFQENSDYLACAVGDVVILCSGKKREKTLAKTIKALRSKTLRLGATKNFIANLAAAKHKQYSFVSIEVIGWMVMIFQQQLAMQPKFATFDLVKKVLREVRPGTSPWIYSFGVRKTVADQAKPPSILITQKITSTSIYELIMRGVMAKVKMQAARNANKGGDTPTEKLPAEKPLEEF